MRKTCLVIFLLLGLNSPLIVAKENTIGLALNPVRLFALGSNQLLSIAGTLSYFDNENSVEFAIPYFYQQDFSNENGSFDEGNIPYKSIDEKIFTLDLQYRKYIRKSQTQGLYYGALLRYAYLVGEAKYQIDTVAKQHKYGVGLLTGFQFKSKIEELDFYWGANISFGGYLNKEVDVMGSDFSVIFGEDGRLFIDVELLKFGMEF